MRKEEEPSLLDRICRSVTTRLEDNVRVLKNQGVTPRKHRRKAPLSTLNSRSVHAAAAHAPARVQIVLQAIEPFDFDLALRYLRAWPATVIEQIEDGVWRRAIALDGYDFALALRSIGSVRRPRLELEVVGAGLTAQRLEQIRGLVIRAFALDVDPRPFRQTIAGEPVLATVVERYHALRPLLIIDPFEALVWGILCQQINLAFARRLKMALIELCGRRLEIDGHSYLLFPSPAAVLELDPQLLRERQYSRQKIAYILGAAQALVAGTLDFSVLATLPVDQALARLTSFKGIGRWTAEYLLLRTLGFPDVIAAADVGLRRVIGQAYGLGGLASEAQVRHLALRWEGWRGWAAFYWWLDAVMTPRPSHLTSTVPTQ
ncbi:MAG TPA: AlkA N-terminal domain-containing protein [Candidatus Binataceae bacterium]|nr:AlkA N-terminal domain-containing protein [Candidatus Binataceae bacterium]